MNEDTAPSRLPADYAHEHVRLGYAATEHGYQSDTVDHSIALSSAATTRRGLYVAATRGRDENLLCVVTDSDDVAEARDVLDGILALDRADIPAVTQRRTLAHQTRSHEPDPAAPVTARCATPDWFDPLRRQVRAELVIAQRAAEASRIERERLTRDLAAAERDLAGVDEATRSHRHRLAAANADLERASRQRAAAEWRLHSSGIRRRRHARVDLTATDRQLMWTKHRLDELQAQSGPHLESYNAASASVDAARARLDDHDSRTRLHRRTVDLLERRADALDTWRRWARGDTVDIHELGGAIDVLRTDAGQHTVALPSSEPSRRAVGNHDGRRAADHGTFKVNDKGDRSRSQPVTRPTEVVSARQVPPSPASKDRSIRAELGWTVRHPVSARHSWTVVPRADHGCGQAAPPGVLLVVPVPGLVALTVVASFRPSR